ncbi:Gfo/Idh/MocA family protein [Actinoplanes sp. HUAS TT8]|uniref:Gfo/Idh/MocA family protein n=1 Tax=Actinoplanes sp. HUAS TT8 TaxID=3447453 RepID=UPI003F5203D2
MRYRAAIVGTGAIAAAHASALRKHASRVDLVAVADLVPERAAAFAETWGPLATYRDLSELLRVPLDLVHLCTPPATHATLIAECLRAGVGVLVEKPPVLSLQEIDAISDRSGRVGTIFQHRFGTGAARLRELIKRGDLGRPLLATCHTLWYRDDEYYEVPWRGRWATEGGGPTMGHGIHQFDLLLSVLGPWQRISAVAARRSRPIETEDVSMALVEFADGTIASVVNSVVSPRQTSTLRFDFEHATVELEHLYGYSDLDWKITPAPGYGDLTGLFPGTGTEKSSHADQLAAVLDALDAGEPLPVTLPETRLTMEFIAALYASAATGKPVGRGEIGPDHPFAARMNGTGFAWQNYASTTPSNGR